MVTDFEALFPGLTGTRYQVTSPKNDVYNCIAWAAKDTQVWWWPDPGGQLYWPAGVQRAEALSAFREAFESLGYSLCSNDGLEAGFEVSRRSPCSRTDRATQSMRHDSWQTVAGPASWANSKTSNTDYTTFKERSAVGS